MELPAESCLNMKEISLSIVILPCVSTAASWRCWPVRGVININFAS